MGEARIVNASAMARRNRTLLIGGLVVLALVLGGIRYFSPTWTASNFINAFSDGRTQEAQGLLCADSGLQQTISATNGLENLFGVHPDPSHLTYAIANESLSTANVSVSGTTTVLGVTTQSKGTIGVKSSGLDWCVESLGNE